MKIAPNEIAFDIDGVFADTFRVFVNMARKNFGYQFHYEDITEYEFMKVIDIDGLRPVTCHLDCHRPAGIC